MLDVGLERKIVQKSGSYFSFGDERLGQGRQNATAFLREHPDVVQQILARIQARGRPGAGRLGAAAADASPAPSEVTPESVDEVEEPEPEQEAGATRPPSARVTGGRASSVGPCRSTPDARRSRRSRALRLPRPDARAELRLRASRQRGASASRTSARAGARDARAASAHARRRSASPRTRARRALADRGCGRRR